jgi:hypothetical protein
MGAMAAFAACTAQILSVHPWLALASALTEAKESPATDSSTGLAGVDMRLLAKASYSDSLTAGCTITRPGSA